MTCSTAALAAVMGKRVAVGESRGKDLRHASGAHVVATYHPSALLRAPDEDARDTLERALVADVKRAARLADAS